MKNDTLNIDWELITTILEGSAGKDDQLHFEKWLKEGENHQYFKEIKTNWEATGNLSYCYNTETNAAWDKVSKQTIYKKTKTRKIRTSILQLAAAAILVFTIGAYFLLQEKQELISKNDPINDYLLPDSSKVSLNRNSKLVFVEGFKGKNRELWLEGEAFFDVKRNPEKPFVIHVGNNLVEVLGTSFNINENTEREYIELNVERGKVRFKSNDLNRSLVVEKGQAIIYNSKDNDLVRLKKANINYLSWKTNLIRFEQTPMTEVVLTLESVYGKQIIIKSDELKELKFSASFSNQAFEKVLKVIALSLNIETKNVNNTIEMHQLGD